MFVPINSIIAITPIRIDCVTNEYPYMVVSETEHSVKITKLTEKGEIINPKKTRTIRKTSIIAILKNMDEFAQIKSMNDELKGCYSIFMNKQTELADRLGKLTHQ